MNPLRQECCEQENYYTHSLPPCFLDVVRNGPNAVNGLYNTIICMTDHTLQVFKFFIVLRAFSNSVHI